MGVFEGTEDCAHDRDREFCMKVAGKVRSESELPVECKQFDDAVMLLKRRNSSRSAYAGMSPGEAIDAMRAKDEGHLSNAQIQRRMTTRKNGRTF